MTLPVFCDRYFGCLYCEFVVPSLLAVGSSGFWDRYSSARNKSRSRFYLVVETRVFSAATCADDFAYMR